MEECRRRAPEKKSLLHEAFRRGWPEVSSSVLVRAIWRWQRHEAKRLGAEGKLHGGAICFWQWFGSRLQLTPHLHLLVPEALWRADGVAGALPPPSEDEVAKILTRVLLQAAKNWPDEAVWADDEYEELQQQAIQHRLPLEFEEAPPHRSRRLAVARGFSLHADTSVHGNDRQGLERLARYGSRGPVAENRLRRLDDGRYAYTPKKGSIFTLSAEALVRRLVALLPPAKLHLTSFHGVYAPNAKLRSTVMQSPSPAPQLSLELEAPAKVPKPKPRLDWATLHQRTFGADVLRCPCGGRRTVRALHPGRNAAEKRLAQLGVLSFPSRRLPPATAPPQLSLAL